MNIQAAAKINLTLSVTGRNDTGYHELISAVCFTSFCDRLSITPTNDETATHLSGPFAAALEKAGGDHLIANAYELAQGIRPDIARYKVQIDKQIPLGGGLGGGSADAAAFLRAISNNWSEADKEILKSRLTTLGADVPACFDNQMHVMAQNLQNVTSFSAPDKRPIMVITNPLIHADTARVFRTYAECTKTYSDITSEKVSQFLHEGTWQDLLAIGNDLTSAACQLYPQISDLLSAMGQSHMMGKQELLGTAMSGSGASCFALLSDEEAADYYVSMLENKGIWCQKTHIF